MLGIRILLFTVLCFACGQNSKSFLKEEMDIWNNPDNIAGADSALVRQILRLPDNGFVSKNVWVTSWYPNSNGGTSYRSDPYQYSPIEKYDISVNDASMRATRWEIRDSRNSGNVLWSGHCNGLAAASTMTDEPRHPVTFNNVTFSVEDIKALLIEAWQAGGVTVGGRCNNKVMVYDGNGRIIATSCRDTNPATFHIALTNFLGVFKKPIIADIDLGYPVWNYPIVEYNIKLKQRLDIRSANWWLFSLEKDTYEYNPNAVSFMYYQTEILLSKGFRSIYEYILELDGNDNIIGGEWFRNAKESHPDFIWRHTTPMAENPYLDVKTVYDIYFQSLTDFSY